MVRFFSKIRNEILTNSKTNRYMLYAVGEVLLVIVGILIALQIDNWNDERIDQKEIREYALGLSAAIERDLEMLEPVEMQIWASIRQSEVLAAYLRDRSIDEIDNAELFFMSTHMGYRPYGWNRAALEQLKAAGGLRRMQNRQLAQRISDYDALTQHLDQDYREDQEASRDIWDLIYQMVDLNYERVGLEEVLTWPDGFTAEDIERRLRDFRDTDLFVRVASLERPLLSLDAAAFRRLGNLNIEYADSTRPRPEIELPRLREFAAEIQTLIDQEYH
jgi:hypothetical protein